MVVQVLLQVGERSLYLVVRVRHSPAVFSLTGEEIRQVEVQAVHRSSQPLMRIVHLSVLVEALVSYRILPLFFPFLVILLEICLVSLVQPAHQVFQLPAGVHLGIQRQIPPDNLLHMELAHLYRVF